jgi:plasmid stabilization system protein ParE
MGYQVIFAPEAERDLNEIIAYIAQAKSRSCPQVRRKISRPSPQLKRITTPGRIRATAAGNPQARSCQYLIYYQIRQTERTVEVLRFWHGARRRPKL